MSFLKKLKQNNPRIDAAFAEGGGGGTLGINGYSSFQYSFRTPRTYTNSLL
jgi:hypothetical protein